VNQFIEECRREWRRLRVPKSVAEDMAAELETDLAEARAEGISPEELLGDPRSLAAAWAQEHGSQQRRTWIVPAAIAVLFAVAVAGALLAVFAPPSRSAAPFTRLAAPPPSSTRMIVTDPVRVWVPAEPPRSTDDTRRIGFVLLVAGLAGAAPLTVFWLSRRRAL
jgi:hypothetical protein